MSCGCCRCCFLLGRYSSYLIKDYDRRVGGGVVSVAVAAAAAVVVFVFVFVLVVCVSFVILAYFLMKKSTCTNVG